MTEVAGVGTAAVRAEDDGAVLLVYGGEPWQRNGGGVFLEQFSRALSRRVVHMSIALDGTPHPARDDWEWEHLSVAARGPVRGLGKLRRFSKRLASWLEWRVARPRQLAAGLANQSALLRSLGISRIVYFLNSIEVLQLAPRLNSLLGVPYSTMEWDLIEIAIKDLEGGTVRDQLTGAATRLRMEAASRGVASEGMAAMYRDRWGLPSLVLRQTIAPAAPQPAKARNAFVLGLCGTMIVPAEFRALLDALALLDWTVDDRPIEFFWIGEPDADQRDLPQQVRWTGWVSHSRSLELLANVDLGYSGLWFASDRRPIVESSFPSKIISYLSAGVPVFYHGPDYGTPARFLSEFPAGFGCHTLDPAEIAADIQSIVRSPEALRGARRAAVRAVAAEFTPAVLRERVGEFLRARDISPNVEPRGR